MAIDKATAGQAGSLDGAQVKPDRVVDARGSFCPGPLMELIKTIKAQPVGTVVELWSSDRGSSKDVPEWIKKAGHDLLYVLEEGDHWRIGVRKAR